MMDQSGYRGLPRVEVEVEVAAEVMEVEVGVEVVEAAGARTRC